MNEVNAALVKVANHLAEIQIEGVDDLKGFSNADKTFGAHLAAIVESDPSDVDAIATLAALVGIKYQRQVSEIVGDKMLIEFKKLAKGVKITPEQRAAAKKTVVAQPDVHEKYGARILLMFPFNPEFSWALKELGCKPFHGPDGWKWVVPIPAVEAAIGMLKAQGAKIVGSYDTTAIKPMQKQRDNVIHCKVVGRKAWLSFDYNANAVAALRTLQGREYDEETRSWGLPVYRISEALEALEKVPNVDLTEVREVASSVHPAARPVHVEEPAIHVDFDKFPDLRPYQRTGIEWLTRPMSELRAELGASVRGMILGDDMGLGKTFQSIVAAEAIAERGEHVLVVCPATVKLNWRDEIMKWTGCEESDIHIIEPRECEGCKHGGAFHSAGRCLRMLDEKNNPITKTTRLEKTAEGKVVEKPIKWHHCNCSEPLQGGFDDTKRWNIVNYDLFDTFYTNLEASEYAVLIIDEAHYAKNRESARSRYIVGGNVVQARLPDARDQRSKAPVKIDGLAAHVGKRVFPLTGTPLTSRPRDLFNLLRAVGHPLGKNFKSFAMRYCEPEYTGFGTSFKGASNVSELREKVDSVLLQRKKEDYLHELPGLQRNWIPVEVDLQRYKAIMAEFQARREAGELKSKGDYLSYMTEARVSVADAMIPRTIEVAESKIEQGAKVIIFSIYSRCVNELKKHFGDRAIVVDGKLTVKQKYEAVQRFQSDDKLQVLIGNYMNGKGAAVGVNITAASQVIFNDLDWVPGNISQAWCRAYRMGQKRFVEATFLIAAGTFCEEMAFSLEEKCAVVNEFERVQGNLFDDLVKRLESAPQNAEVKELFEGRMRMAGKKQPGKEAA